MQASTIDGIKDECSHCDAYCTSINPLNFTASAFMNFKGECFQVKSGFYCEATSSLAHWSLKIIRRVFPVFRAVLSQTSASLFADT